MSEAQLPVFACSKLVSILSVNRRHCYLFGWQISRKCSLNKPRRFLIIHKIPTKQYSVRMPYDKIIKRNWHLPSQRCQSSEKNFNFLIRNRHIWFHPVCRMRDYTNPILPIWKLSVAKRHSGLTPHNADYIWQYSKLILKSGDALLIAILTLNGSKNSALHLAILLIWRCQVC